jgi:hypothetical protein
VSSTMPPAMPNARPPRRSAGRAPSDIPAARQISPGAGQGCRENCSARSSFTTQGRTRAASNHWRSCRCCQPLLRRHARTKCSNLAAALDNCFDIHNYEKRHSLRERSHSQASRPPHGHGSIQLDVSTL